MSFSSTLLHARKSRANSEISELLTARRMDITVWMSSQTMWCPRSRKRGATRVARGGQLLQTVPERPSVAAWALVYPRVGTGREAAAGVGLFPARSGKLFRSRGGATGLLLGLLGLGLLYENLGAFGHPIVGRMLLETIHAGGFLSDSQYAGTL
ncbi:hypothetical protein EVAR_74663_1 [Eumeta japonica]|uniref:Uncharacterized protein n=1 Tax=Eumeta variegata TaxID=151549 RepID=A0A4C1W9U6_EUMVA|nr:hypothetical protein EVAR_74663_1 [Eumeta japonica]